MVKRTEEKVKSNLKVKKFSLGYIIMFLKRIFKR